MRKLNIGLVIAIVLISLIYSCQNTTEKENTSSPDNKADTTSGKTMPLRDKVLTAEEQQALTPDMVIQSLVEGNKRFVSNDLTARDHSAMVRRVVKGQYPKAVILSCMDSRVPVEDVFNKGIGDLFVIRIAGNFADEDMLGSMEYGCKVSGAKLIVVLGHESCGAIKAAIDNVKMGNITGMLTRIQPAVKRSQNFAGEKTSKNDAFVEYVAKNNVLNTIETIKQRSPILKQMLDSGQIKIVGAYYDLKTGEVAFL